MNKIWISVILIVSLMGLASAIDGSGVELQPEEDLSGLLFNYGIGEPGIGENPISPSTSDSMFSQYYSIYGGPSTKKHIESPKRHETTSKIPTAVYINYQMQAVPYSQYQTYAAYMGSNSLWIQGSTSWTQYARVPQMSILSLLAISPTGGDGYLYEIYPDGKLSKNNFYFYPGDSEISFYADSIGQHILLFVIGNQVSNAIVIDVTAPYQWYEQQIPTYQPPQILPPTSTPLSPLGDTPAKIVSQGMQGYQVFLDGAYIGTEGTGGDPRDGKFSFSVVGDRNHGIRVYDGQFNYPKTMYFERGVQKIIYVEPGTAVYI